MWLSSQQQFKPFSNLWKVAWQGKPPTNPSHCSKIGPASSTTVSTFPKTGPLSIKPSACRSSNIFWHSGSDSTLKVTSYVQRLRTSMVRKPQWFGSDSSETSAYPSGRKNLRPKINLLFEGYYANKPTHHLQFSCRLVALFIQIPCHLLKKNNEFHCQNEAHET